MTGRSPVRGGSFLCKAGCQGPSPTHPLGGQPLAEDTQSLLGRALFPVQPPMAPARAVSEASVEEVHGAGRGLEAAFEGTFPPNR